ncbi:MAG TPA: hypothetical protein VMR96_09095, partial [Solirubrobacterales bacterium]|nr:hypothetical protein [Solirubrobacterales bacterium]
MTSAPAGIECSNTSGGEKLSADDCSGQYVFLFNFENVQLTADPDPGSVFAGWTADGFDGNCNSGLANPCKFTDAGEFGLEPVHVTAKFEPPPDPPQATTGPAENINYFNAALTGEVNPEGTTVTECHFEYGPTKDYGDAVPCAPGELGEGSSFVPVSAKTAALEPATIYHYRLVATNPGGASNGEDQTFSTAAAPQDDCPNAAIRAQQGIRAIRLPECMALELVSPPVKANQFARRASLSADGDRAIFESVAALGGTPRQGGIFDRYVSSRTSSGWSTTSTVPPVQYTVGYLSTGLPCVYSPDFSHWATFASTTTQAKVGIVTALQGSTDDPFSALSPTMTPTFLPDGTDTLTFGINNADCEGSSADTNHFFFNIVDSFTYLPGEPKMLGFGTFGNVYDAYQDENGVPSVRILQRDGNGVVIGGHCGAEIGAQSFAYSVKRGAISPDASRIYFTTRPGQKLSDGNCQPTVNLQRIMKRVETPAGPWISEPIQSECDRVAPACSTNDGDDGFEAASQEGGKLFFTTVRQLANSDLDTGPGPNCRFGSAYAGCDLYLHDASQPEGEQLTQVSAGDATTPTPGQGAEILGVAALGGDGSHVYFVAQGVLTTHPNSEGASAVAGQPNLYLYEKDANNPNGRTVFISTLTPEDEGVWRVGAEGVDAFAVPTLGIDPENQSVGGDGHLLVFNSRASLVASDTDGGLTDVYRFDSVTGDLVRVSQAAPGGSDNGPFPTMTNKYTASADPGPQKYSVGRFTSEDGETIVFETAEALDPTDTNQKE